MTMTQTAETTETKIFILFTIIRLNGSWVYGVDKMLENRAR